MLLVFITLLLTLDAALITFQPPVKYVKPGDDFDLKCSSDIAAAVKIFSPAESLPPKEQIVIMNSGFNFAEKTTTINDYFRATTADSGLYTCLIMHGPSVAAGYTIGHVQVIVVDLCEDSNCDENESCETDYETGTAKCTCPEDMCDEFIRVFEPLCTDTCEQFFNDCHLRQTTCMDKKSRTVTFSGLCPKPVKPTVRQQNLDINAIAGDVIQLHSGVVADGVPEASISWTFTSADGEMSDVDGGMVLSITVNEPGVYESKIVHCKDESQSVGSTYNIIVSDLITEAPEPITKRTCGVYNNGVIEKFDSTIVHLALNCHHVLVAEPGNGWFIYGKFSAESSLESLSFYVQETVFEIQRGWIVNVHGEKVILTEGEEQDVGVCSVLFQDLHLRVSCGTFNVLYDGAKIGYINMFSDPESAGSLGGLGLCYGLNVPEGYGASVNWQVGNTAAPCLLPEVKECSSSESCDELSDKISGACNCAEGKDTCELMRANMVRDVLQGQGTMDGKVEACPDDCEWKAQVVAGGCPQPDATFLCNIT